MELFSRVIFIWLLVCSDLPSHCCFGPGQEQPKSWLEGLILVTPSCEHPNNTHFLSSHLNLKCECGKVSCCILDHWQNVKLHSQPSSWQESRRKCAREALSLGRKVWRLDSMRAAKGKRWWFISFPWERSCLIWRALPAVKSEAAVYRLLIGDRMSQSKQFFIHFVEIL